MVAVREANSPFEIYVVSCGVAGSRFERNQIAKISLLFFSFRPAAGNWKATPCDGGDEKIFGPADVCGESYSISVKEKSSFFYFGKTQRFVSSSLDDEFVALYLCPRLSFGPENHYIMSWRKQFHGQQQAQRKAGILPRTRIHRQNGSLTLQLEIAGI